MRIFVFSLISCVLFSACSHKEQIAHYEQQLKESNEALEGIINYRISSFKMMASENPEKAGPWAKKAYTYFEACQNVIENWPLNKSDADNFLASLDELRNLDLAHIQCPNIELNTDDPSFEFFKNQIQINLNCYLKELAHNISVADLWWISYINPVKVKMEDSTLIILEGVLTQHVPNYTVSIDQSFKIDLHTSTSLAHFFIPKKFEDSLITGKIELFDNYSPDVEYFQFKIDPGNDNPTSQIQFYTPPTIQQKNP